MNNHYDIVIIGSGLAGLTAGLYCGRARLKTVILEKDNLGGVIINIEMIENWPGVEEDSIMGADLAGNTLSQVLQYNVDMQCPADVSGIELLESGIKKIHTENENYSAKAIIIAGGTHPKNLEIKGLDEFFGNGVYDCVLCDGDPLAGKHIAVIGGGDAGVTGALYMARLGCKIILVEVLPNLTATKVLQERINETQNVEIICSTGAESIEAKGDVRALQLKDVVTGEQRVIDLDGIFILAGREPQTEYLKGILEMDRAGFINVTNKMETNVPGIFAAGDIRRDSARQIITAAGDGATAAISAERFISERSW
ncbi:NAD(P)/FAD-dependent oxidoreductase [Thermodesulfobacteriota bacterium]